MYLGVGGHLPGGEAKGLWDGLVRYKAGRSLEAGSELGCSFVGDKMVPLN